MESKQRFLYLDSDIIIIGRLLGELEKYDEDFIISPSKVEDPLDPHVSEYYYHFDQLKKIDPDFKYPNWVFNAGQFLGTSGILTRADFSTFVEWTDQSAKMPDNEIFEALDQGLLNYLFPKFAQTGKITINAVDFKIFAHPDNMSVVDLESIKRKEGIPKLVHYAGEKKPLTSMYLRGETLAFFEDYYYKKLPYGWLKQHSLALKRFLKWLPGRTLKQIKILTPKSIKDMLKK